MLSATFSTETDGDESLKGSPQLSSRLSSAGASGVPTQTVKAATNRHGFPVALLLQALLVSSVFFVLIASCALFSSFVMQQRTAVAQRLMAQYSECSSRRLSGWAEASTSVGLGALKNAAAEHQNNIATSRCEGNNASLAISMEELLHVTIDWVAGSLPSLSRPWTLESGGPLSNYLMLPLLGDDAVRKGYNTTLSTPQRLVAFQVCNAAGATVTVRVNTQGTPGTPSGPSNLAQLWSASWFDVCVCPDASQRAMSCWNATEPNWTSNIFNAALRSARSVQISDDNLSTMGLRCPRAINASSDQAVAWSWEASLDWTTALCGAATAAVSSRYSVAPIDAQPNVTVVPVIVGVTPPADATSLVFSTAPLVLSHSDKDSSVVLAAAFATTIAYSAPLPSSIAALLRTAVGAARSMNQSIFCAPPIDETSPMDGLAQVVTLGGNAVAAVVLRTGMWGAVPAVNLLRSTIWDFVSSSAVAAPWVSFSPGPSGITTSARMSSNDFDHGQVAQGTNIMVAISLAVGLFIAGIGSLFVHILTKGLIRLAADLNRVANMDVMEDESATTEGRVAGARSRLRLRQIAGSVFHELDGVARGLRTLSKHVLIVVRTVPSLDPRVQKQQQLDTSDLESTALQSRQGSTHYLDDDVEDEATILSEVVVDVVYESRSSLKVFGKAKFRFSFDADDSSASDCDDVFTRLVAECLQSCGEDPFQQVSLTYISNGNEQISLRDSVQLLEVLSVVLASTTAVVAGGENESTRQLSGRSVAEEPVIKILMHKTTQPKITVQLTSFADVINFASTIAFVVGLFLSSSESRQDPTLIAFCCLYGFAITMNFVLCWVLIRQTIAKDPKFCRWAQQRLVERCICHFFCTMNLQNFELMWTGIRLEVFGRTILFFNAPRNDGCVYRSVQWSLFGFLFADVTQLVFKIWRVVLNGSNIEIASLLTLVSSGISVLFNLCGKLYATFLWSRSSTSVSEGAQRALLDPTADKVAESPTGQAALSQRDVSIVYIEGRLPSDVIQLSLLAVEWCRYYEAVLAAAKKVKATPLHMHSGTVVLGLNVTRPCVDHEVEAVRLALRVRSILASQDASHWSVAATVTSGVYLAGIVGSYHRKSSQVLFPFQTVAVANEAALLAVSHGGVVQIPTTLAVSALGLEEADLAAGRVVETEEYVDGQCLQVMRPMQLFSSLRRDTSVVNVVDMVFVFTRAEGPPQTIDMRSRMATAFIGLRALDVEALRDAFRRFFAKQWGSTSPSAVTPVVRGEPLLRTPLTATLDVTDETCPELYSQCPTVNRGTANEPKGFCVVSPRRLFGGLGK